MKKIIKEYDFKLLPKKRLNDFEKEVGVLPVDYKLFLSTFNGGILLKNEIIHHEKFYYVSKLLGLYLEKEYYWASINWYIKTIEGRSPKNTIPIADDSGGNLFLMNLKNDNNYGKIYFWNHERSERLNKNIDNLGLVANDFSSFINSLHINKNIDINIDIIETDDEFIID